MKNVLVVNVNWLGDAVFSLPVFAGIRSAHPGARITCLCVSRVAEVLRYCSDIDEIIVLDEKGVHFWPWQKAALIGYLRTKRFDTAFVLHASLSRALIVWLAGIKSRIGFSKWPWLMSCHVDNSSEGAHRMDHYLKVVEAAGIVARSRSYRLNAPKAEPPVPGEYVVLNVGGNWDLKQWPPACWAELARHLSALRVKLVFTGSDKDKDVVSSIVEKSGAAALNLCGQTTLGQSLSIYAHSQAVISADSGPLHLANSVGANVIALFGPTRQEITGPRGYGQKCILFHECGCNKAPCYHLGCADNVCMKGISVNEVLQAYQRLAGH